MPAAPSRPTPPSPALVAMLNAVPNVLWSVLALGPLSVFCYQHMARPWLYGLLAGSLLIYGVPRAWFRYWQLSRSVRPYQQLGVPAVNHFTQYGGLVSKILRRSYPQYRHVPSRTALRGLIAGSYHQERFHTSLLLFFAAASVYALWYRYLGWALLLTGLNVGYNLYPVWLQQYVRLRAAPATDNP